MSDRTEIEAITVPVLLEVVCVCAFIMAAAVISALVCGA